MPVTIFACVAAISSSTAGYAFVISGRNWRWRFQFLDGFARHLIGIENNEGAGGQKKLEFFSSPVSLSMTVFLIGLQKTYVASPLPSGNVRRTFS